MPSTSICAARYAGVLQIWGFVVLTVLGIFPSVDRPANSQALQAPATDIEDDQAIGRQLFTRHCAGCHGESGDGQGVAANFLFPRPRNLQEGKFRLVSTANRVPSRDDLIAMLRRGMPGSSMPPWDHLPQHELDQLADEVIQIRAEAARQFYSSMLKEEEELTDEELAAPDVEEEIREYVDSVTIADEATEIPEFTLPSPDAIARGREHYSSFGCASCHGTSGRGDGVQAMFDDEQFPTTARDFTLGIFKGGHDTASLYRRIAYGMPGTPMPSSSAMSPEQMVDLVHFLRSLSTEDQRQRTIPRRLQFTAKRFKSLPARTDPVWSQVQPVEIVMFPLWWRNNADPRLHAQFAHDGKELAVRLTWMDDSPNRRAVRPDQFADMVAMQISKGGKEPFLGMGAADSPIELWQWRASSVEMAASDSLMDDYMFDSESYLELLPEGVRPDFITARAAGNPLTIESSSAASLAAQGPGSTTFRPVPCPLVEAEANYQDRHWSVLMRRPLSGPPEQCLALESGEACAVAFAVWDGAFHDRASQKVISIWHDVRLE